MNNLKLKAFLPVLLLAAIFIFFILYAVFSGCTEIKAQHRPVGVAFDDGKFMPKTLKDMLDSTYLSLREEVQVQKLIVWTKFDHPEETILDVTNWTLTPIAAQRWLPVYAIVRWEGSPSKFVLLLPTLEEGMQYQLFYNPEKEAPNVESFIFTYTPPRPSALPASPK